MDNKKVTLPSGWSSKHAAWLRKVAFIELSVMDVPPSVITYLRKHNLVNVYLRGKVEYSLTKDGEDLLKQIGVGTFVKRIPNKNHSLRDFIVESFKV